MCTRGDTRREGIILHSVLLFCLASTAPYEDQILLYLLRIGGECCKAYSSTARTVVWVGNVLPVAQHNTVSSDTLTPCIAVRIQSHRWVICSTSGPSGFFASGMFALCMPTNPQNILGLRHATSTCNEVNYCTAVNTCDFPLAS